MASFRQEHENLLEDLKNLVDGKVAPTQTRIPFIRELWGILKQLRMSEANLQRRLAEFGHPHTVQEGVELSPTPNSHKPDVESLRVKYEAILQECQESHEKDLEELAASVNQTVQAANTETQRLSQELEVTRSQLRAVSDEHESLVQVFSLVNNLGITLLNKWTNMLNLKQCFGQLLNGVVTKPHVKDSQLRRFRIAVLATVFMVRTSRVSRVREMQSTARHLSVEDHKEDSKLVNTAVHANLLMAASTFRKESISFLNAVDQMCRGVDENLRSDGQIDTVISMFFSTNRTRLYDFKQFQLGGRPEHDTPTFRAYETDEACLARAEIEANRVEEYKQRLESAGELLTQTLSLLKQKDTEIKHLQACLMSSPIGLDGVTEG